MSDKHKVENTTVVDPTIIKLTRDTLGQFVKRPPLTEKLLNKPPFRFLHDIMTAVISSTGFMKGLFMDAELDSENVKDKEAKIAFLQKAIDMVSLVTGHSVLAKPNKIVAGQEPEKTNEFLQALAEAVNKKVENSDYVSRVLAAEVERKKLSSKTNKPTSPRKASTVKEPKTEAGAARQEDKTGKSEIKGDKPKPQRQEDKTVKAETKSDMPALQRQEDRTGKSEMKSDKPKPQRQEDKTVKAETKSDMPALQRQEDRTGKSEMKIDKPKPQRQEDKAVESDTKRDKPRSQRLEDNTVKYELKGDKPKPQRQEANTVKSETKSDKPKPQRQEDHTAKSESKSHKPRGQRPEDHAVKSETKSHKPRSQRLEDHTVKSETKSDKPKPQRLEDSTIKYEPKSDKPRPPSHSRDVKGSHSEVKTDKKDVRSEKSVTETDKSETARTESSESKSDKLESRKDKRRVMKTDKQDTKIERQVTKSDSEAHSGKLISPRQITRGAKIESKKEKLESRVIKPIPEHAEVDEPKTDRQKPVLASLDVKDAENSKLVGDAKKNIRGHPNSKTGATLWDLRTGEPGRELLTTENSPNQESKLFANQEPIKVSPRTQSLDSKRQREADQVTGEKQETKTEMPAAAVQNVNSAVSKKETAGKDLLATGGKVSTFASKKETGGKASNLGVGEKQEAKRISPATGRITRYSLNEQPKPKLTQDDGSTDSGQSECVNVRQEKPSDKQRLPKALRNDELKKDAVSNAFTTNKSSSSLTSRLELLTPSHQESPSRDEQDVRNDLPISARHDSFEVIRDVKLQDVRPAAGPGVNSRRPNDGGSLLLNPAEKNDLRLHEHQSAEEFWDSRRERKARRDKTKGEKRTDVKSEKRKVSVSKQDVRPDKLGPRGDRHEIHTIKESRSEKATLKPTQNSPPKSGGEKTDELQLVSQKLTTAFDAETQRFEDEHQKLQIYEPDVDVILDRRDLKGEEDEDDDEAEFLVREDPASVYLPRSSLDLSDESNEHGGLVKKILKTKKGLEALVLSHKATIEIDRSEISGGDISQKRQRALLLKDVGKLRSTIQALTGNVIPLVKIMDFLQEDLDCMKKEMEQWKDEIEANTLALQHEQRLLEASIEPLQLQLSELEKQIEEQEEINAGLKSQALQNEEKIRKIINTAALLSK